MIISRGHYLNDSDWWENTDLKLDYFLLKFGVNIMNIHVRIHIQTSREKNGCC
jgi:hypothetical protein